MQGVQILTCKVWQPFFNDHFESETLKCIYELWRESIFWKFHCTITSVVNVATFFLYVA